MLDRLPSLLVILDHLARPQQEDGPPYKGADSLWELAKYPNVFLKVTERNLVGANAGKATPKSFFGKLVAKFGARRIA
jgi:L-fuconolactonase